MTSLKQPRTGIVLRHPPMSGQFNMELDERLLNRSTSDSPVVIRVYGWKEPTLSLGHFQSELELQQERALLGLPVVRRKTGGGAIVHDLEITYSIVIPNRPNESLKGHSEGLYRAIHNSFVSAIRAQGWDATLSENCTCSSKKSDLTQPFLCFSRRTPVDIVLGQNKILGSAQRRTSTGLLQHGSLLFKRSASAPHLLGLFDLDRHHVANSLSNSAIHNKDLVESSWVPWMIDAIQSGVEKEFPCEWAEAENSPDFDLDGLPAMDLTVD